MSSLAEHIHIFQSLRIYPNKAVIIRLVWHIATEHSKEITMEEFINAVVPKPAVTPLRKPQQ